MAQETHSLPQHAADSWPHISSGYQLLCSTNARM